MPAIRFTLTCLASIAIVRSTCVRADEPANKLRERGRAIYAKSCVDCHGENGEGVEGAYRDALVGDLSVRELADIVDRTMPDGDAKACVGKDAAAVAAYVHHAFYSEAARIRLDPPRVRLAHLTRTQLRQSLADLYARFAGSMWQEPKRGIGGKYFTGARYRRQNMKIERIDAAIDFDWQDKGPGEGIEPTDFFVQWRGSLKVEETGRYEIVVRSTCAFIMDLGKFDREFINNRVQSGDKTEFRKSIVLTAGRVYPLQIDLFQRKRKTKQPPAKISLSWVPPGRVEEVIPRRHLMPASAPATFSLQAALPPDDRSSGYERGLSTDRQWDASTTAAAVEFSKAAADELWPEYRRKNRSGNDRAKLKQFLEDVLETAFRGPLDDAARTFYIDRQVDPLKDDGEAISGRLLVSLKSPRFLYPGLDTNRSASRRAANRLALTMFDSLPADEWLLKLVREDKLKTPEQIRSAAQRMLRDYRAHGKTREMLYEWLNLEHIGEITKDEAHFPKFTPEITSDLKASLDEFLDEAVWGPSGDLRQLFLADWAYTTPRLAEYYGEAWQPADEKSRALSHSVEAPGARVGLLTHPYLMSGLAYRDSTSPIHRGVFLMRFMLGRTLKPPKEAFTPLSPKLHPDLTTRQRVELQTSPQSCQVCHTKINGLGFALEQFDAVGRFRETEGKKPIDTAGKYTTRAGDAVTFRGANELAKFLADSDDVHRAFVKRAFQYFVKQPVAAYGTERLEQLTAQFRKSGFRIRDLLVEIAVVAATQP